MASKDDSCLLVDIVVKSSVKDFCEINVSFLLGHLGLAGGSCLPPPMDLDQYIRLGRQRRFLLVAYRWRGQRR